MNKTVLIIVVALMASAMIATPVLAIGPENATGQNPNLVMRGYGPSLRTPSGMTIEWILAAPIPQQNMFMSAANFKIKTAFVVTDTSQVDGMENKWLYFDQYILAQMLVIWHIPPQAIPFILQQFPQGMYFKWVEVGQ